MARVRLHGLRCLLYALVVLPLIPCVAEFILRVFAVRATYENAVPTQRLLLIPSAFTHHQLAPLQTCGSLDPVEDESVLLRTNSFGLRGPDIQVPKPEGVFRIICVGDETVLAQDTPEKQTFCRRLEELLQPQCRLRIEVINAAVPEYCPLLSYLQIKHLLLGLQPDLFIAHFDPTDIDDDRRFRRLADLDERDVPLICANPALITEAKVKPLCEHFLCVQWVKTRIGNLAGKTDSSAQPDSTALPTASINWVHQPDPNQSQQLLTAVTPIAQLATLIGSRRIPVVLAVHPLFERLSTDAIERSGQSLVENPEANTGIQVIGHFAQQNGVIVCSPNHVMQQLEHPEKALLSDQRTLSLQGHEAYAYALANTILQQVTGPWSQNPAQSQHGSISSIQTASSQTASSQSTPGIVRANMRNLVVASPKPRTQTATGPDSQNRGDPWNSEHPAEVTPGSMHDEQSENRRVADQASVPPEAWWRR